MLHYRRGVENVSVIILVLSVDLYGPRYTRERLQTQNLACSSTNLARFLAKARYTLPVFTGHVPCSRPVNTGSVYRALCSW